ncbi:MAG: phosphatidylserine decarboxylase [Rhodoferax sp.]
MNFLRSPISHVVSCIIISASSVALAEDVAPVAELRKIYSTNANFRKTLDGALSQVKSPYLGQDNPWKGKSFDDFCRFFNDWYLLLPVNQFDPAKPAFPPGQKIDEFNYITIFAGFYYENEEAQKILGQEPGLGWTKEFVIARGKFLDSKLSKSTIPLWTTDSSIKNDEYIVPPDGYQSFNEFFTRNLKPGARTVASPMDDAVLVSPADCVLNMIQPMTLGAKIPTKFNQKLNAKQLLNNSDYAKYFENGAAISCILLPNTYHHYHFVTSGTVVESNQDVAGQYWGMWNFPNFLNDGNFGYGQSWSVFENFRRGYVVIKTKEFGHVAMIPVGLDTIGSVVFEDKFKKIGAPGTVQVSKGEKLGHFAYGGSTVITLIEQGIKSVTIPQGQQIGVFQSKAASK